MTSAANWAARLLLWLLGFGSEEEEEGGQISDKVYEEGFGAEKQFSFTMGVTLLSILCSLVFIFVLDN